MRFYTNRELAERFAIKLARWKRWCREFLDPDPLGGLQSGYARQLTVDDAFTVYLGGYLVSELRYGIPSARLILKDLREWLGLTGFYATPIYRPLTPPATTPPVSAYQIYIFARTEMQFAYTIRGILEENVIPSQDGCVRTVRYCEQILNREDAQMGGVTGSRVRLLNISAVYTHFSRGLTTVV